MKLKNKKTGETAELIEYGTPVEDGRVIFRFKGQTGLFKKTYHSLTELNAEWEDVPEEPKEYWYIDTTEGTVVEHTQEMFELTDKERKQIGNYFKTEEEAEKAVEKLKAFKRLQDLGFRFEGIRFRKKHSYIEWKLEPKNELTDDETGKLLEDLYEVFGGKE